MKKVTLIIALLAGIQAAWAFCGFYVAKADASLFNETSQVILVRDGERTTVTMSSDFKGDVKDFAMVIPVPVVLQEKDIRVVNRLIFDKLDAYSAPRISEYYDESPCYDYKTKDYEMSERSDDKAMAAPTAAGVEKKYHGVTIDAKYTVGEYDILILSAKQSDGLKTWLTENGYKIPNKAEEVLEPYIKSKMKFFVVKVNIAEKEKAGFETLRPLQISFNSNKFMLPLRLGMANSKGTQDMLVYAFSKKGRVETLNYRTAKVPTDIDIPLFVQEKFGKYYVDLFTKAWKREGQNAVMLEYSWDISGSNYVHCDPCTGTPPILSDLREAGVDWLREPNGSYSAYQGEVYFTRLHVRYDREHFPQDLAFQETPNHENFQCRYVMHHPVAYGLECSEAKNYYKEVYQRRMKEIQLLASTTGWDVSQYGSYVEEYATKAGLRVKKSDIPAPPVNVPNNDNTPNDNNPIGSTDVTVPTSNYTPTEYAAEPNNPMKYIWVGLMGLLIGVSLMFGQKKKETA